MENQGLFTRGLMNTRRDQLFANRTSAKAPIRHLDLTLLFAVMAIGAFGAVFIKSASRHRLAALGFDENLLLKRHLIFLSIGVVIFIGMMLFDYRQLRALAPVTYGVGVILLLAVLSPLGERVAGAQRWINLGPLQFQPSEIMKAFLLVALAAWYADERTDPGVMKLAGAAGMTFFPAFLVYVQPDLGTVMVMLAVLFGVLLISGTRVRWLVVLLLAGVLFFIAALQLGVLKDYQVARLTAFLDTHSDVQRAGYNLAQSKIAIGSGGWDGKGIGEGSQTNLDYVPAQHTDFIFTAIGEETGFVGAVTLIGLFAFLIWRSLRVAMLSKDLFGTLLAGAVATMLIFQIFVNIGMTIGIMPITGIPLPFVSYGGTALITNFIAIGLLMNVHMRRFV